MYKYRTDQKYAELDSDIETLLFIKELGRLIEDIQKCPDEKLTEKIYQDILLLSSVINPKSNTPIEY